MKEPTSINQIMKNYKPWYVGIATLRSENSIFFPIAYNRKQNRWYGFVRQTCGGWLEYAPAWRKGTGRKYQIIISWKIKEISPNCTKHIIEWLKEHFPKRNFNE